jgi:hypothetical protein
MMARGEKPISTSRIAPNAPDGRVRNGRRAILKKRMRNGRRMPMKG